MFFQRLKTPGLGHNSYVVECGEGMAVVVDPQRDISQYLRLARENDLTIAYVLESHRQEDFEFGSRALAQATGAKIVGGCNPLFGQVDVMLEDGKELEVGTARIVAHETPGARDTRPYTGEHDVRGLRQGRRREVLGCVHRRRAVRR